MLNVSLLNAARQTAWLLWFGMEACKSDCLTRIAFIYRICTPHCLLNLQKYFYMKSNWNISLQVKCWSGYHNNCNLWSDYSFNTCVAAWRFGENVLVSGHAIVLNMWTHKHTRTHVLKILGPSTEKSSLQTTLVNHFSSLAHFQQMWLMQHCFCGTKEVKQATSYTAYHTPSGLVTSQLEVSGPFLTACRVLSRLVNDFILWEWSQWLTALKKALRWGNTSVSPIKETKRFQVRLQ